MLGFISPSQQTLRYTLLHFHIILFYKVSLCVPVFCEWPFTTRPQITFLYNICGEILAHHSLTIHSLLCRYKSREMMTNNLGIFAFWFITFSTKAESEDFYGFLTSRPFTPPTNAVLCPAAMQISTPAGHRNINKNPQQPRWYLLANANTRTKVTS